ncbi:Uncharacterized protein CTYZ_00001677 [Cryptosporidium tyzzeri]|nr:Uncharacterized protein CTYZ_00001677 [Cryptosporidium tyzzeri]
MTETNNILKERELTSLSIGYSTKVWNHFGEIFLREILEFGMWYLDPFIYLACVNSVLLSISCPKNLIIKVTSRVLSGSTFYAWFLILISFALHIFSIQASTIITFLIIRLRIFNDFKERISKNSLFQAINQMAETNPISLVLLTRLSLFLPLTFTNLILALSTSPLAISALSSGSKQKNGQFIYNPLEKWDFLINFPIFLICSTILVISIIHRYLSIKENEKTRLDSDINN